MKVNTFQLSPMSGKTTTLKPRPQVMNILESEAIYNERMKRWEAKSDLIRPNIHYAELDYDHLSHDKQAWESESKRIIKKLSKEVRYA